MSVQLLHGDCRTVLPTLADQSVQCVVTSPPYFGLRNYNVAGQIGLEATPSTYVAALVAVFAEVWRVLKDDGVLFLNLGDSYGHGTTALRQQSKTSVKISADQHAAQGGRHGGKAKNLLGIPWRMAFALQDAGWTLRAEIIWHKPNAMPESVTDRPTRDHEQIFLFSKQSRYFYDADAIKEPTAWPVERAGKRPGTVGKGTGALGQPNFRSSRAERQAETRNSRTVWSINTTPYPGAHFATFPPELARRCILAGSREGDTVLDPFGGSGTVASVAAHHGRAAISIDLNAEYISLQRDRVGLFVFDGEAA